MEETKPTIKHPEQGQQFLRGYAKHLAEQQQSQYNVFKSLLWALDQVDGDESELAFMRRQFQRKVDTLQGPGMDDKAKVADALCRLVATFPEPEPEPEPEPVVDPDASSDATVTATNMDENGEPTEVEASVTVDGESQETIKIQDHLTKGVDHTQGPVEIGDPDLNPETQGDEA